MTFIHPSMSGLPNDRERELTRRQTGDKEPSSPTGDDSDSFEEDEKDEEEDDDDLRPPQDPVKVAFDEILEQIKNKELKLGRSEERKKFFHRYEKYLEERIGEKKNLLHVLAYYEGSANISMKSLVTQLCKKYPKEYARLLVAKDDTGSENNPLYAAITRKNFRLVAYLCENKEGSQTVTTAIETALAMSCGERGENCLHAAIRSKMPAQTAISLIRLTNDETLKAQDSKGFTPLHYAVEYERCTDSQFDVVKTLIECGDSALDKLGNKPDYFSVYRYHENTHERAFKTTKPNVKAMAEKEKERVPPVREEDLRRPDGLNKKGMEPDKLDPRPEALQQRPRTQREGPHSLKDERKPGDLARPQRRDTDTNSPVEPNGPPHNGYLHAPSQGGPVMAGKEAPHNDSLNPGVRFSKETPKRESSVARSRRVEEPEVTEESAEKIRELLQLHYLRTRSPETAASRLYGKNPNAKHICFDYLGAPSKVNPEEFKDSFEHVKLDSVLQYVAFSNLEVRPAPEFPYSLDNPVEAEGKGRCDMMFFFEWLRQDKGVKRILKVIVEDLDTPAHSDEAIEKTLEGFNVEILDWRKTDLCPETMYTSSSKLREIYLRWSGNNAVLRSWSEPDGLRRFEDLEKVHLHVKQDLETSMRTKKNIDKFCERLNSSTPTIEQTRAVPTPDEQPTISVKPSKIIRVSRIEQDGQHERLLTMNLAASPGEIKQEQTLQPHRWLTCMDEFREMIQNVWSWSMKQKLQQQNDLQKPVEIALIDDGIDVLQPRLRGKISDGKSFDFGDKGANRIRSHWISERGHGTVMAKNIARICPMAKIYVIKLETHFDHKEQKSRIGARSAADAIDAAVDRKVQIISMSWTIAQPSTSDEKERLDTAIRRAISAGILLFCSSADKGLHQDNDYPAASNPSKMFRIGAAKANGNAWDWVPNITNLDFIIPGHEVAEKALLDDDPSQTFQPQTGSSVATALGAGLAALIICCVQLAAIHTQMNQQVDTPTAVTVSDLREVKRHDGMKAAFGAIGTSMESQNKFVEVWRVFDKAAKEMRVLEKERRLGVVAALAPKFVRNYGM
ncbi:hypothetical protein BJ875DRAFT_453856 [Amylocarpus encephaloides]|uniref:Peptidase S8/S53 domain-containing protein n=1 Tax=Amylocarpus encephaloides TaxID=45428 RepID=A0A9P8C852_9HELO|nr:hypothetical protein BJ875DRAFT_453856 [Amylocarpus encephaloides]